MKKNIFLFHRFDKHAVEHFKIKNAILRNKNIFVETRGYINEVGWKEFVKSFIDTNTKVIIDNDIIMDYEFSGFILMYDDLILGKKVVVIDYDKILEILTS